jgi:hypothetical protein
MIGYAICWLWLRRQPVGTRSLLVGGHQFVLHPLAVALAWRRLYGRFPRQLPYWAAFALHDVGYWGRADMDGRDGKGHPDPGATLLAGLFDPDVADVGDPDAVSWWEFSAGHSRGYARLVNIPVSRLQAPDKLATGMLPRWLLGLLYWLSGEWVEYKERWMRHATPPYPGRSDDNAWAFAGHIKDEWRRFARADADPGVPFA